MAVTENDLLSLKAQLSTNQKCIWLGKNFSMIFVLVLSLEEHSQ